MATETLMGRLTRSQREQLTDEVLDELRAGNWPTCPGCGAVECLTYIGLVTDAPTFMCRCGHWFAMDLRDAD